MKSPTLPSLPIRFKGSYTIIRQYSFYTIILWLILFREIAINYWFFIDLKVMKIIKTKTKFFYFSLSKGHKLSSTYSWKNENAISYFCRVSIRGICIGHPAHTDPFSSPRVGWRTWSSWTTPDTSWRGSKVAFIYYESTCLKVS